MEKRVETKSIIKALKTSDFVLNCRMGMEYVTGLPILQIRNGNLCLLVPFLKYKVTGEVDKTLVYPIRYTVTVGLPGAAPAEFRDLTYDALFERVDFEKAIGTFRHESVKQYTKDEYFALKDELFSLCDKTANMLLYGDECRAEDDDRMRELFQILIEPSLLPIYKVLDRDFYHKYLA